MSLVITTRAGTVRRLAFARSQTFGRDRDLELFRPPLSDRWLVAGSGHERPTMLRIVAELAAGAGKSWRDVSREVDDVLADAADAVLVRTPLGVWHVDGLEQGIPQAVGRGWRIDFVWLATDQVPHIATSEGARLVTHDGSGILVWQGWK